MQGSCLGVCELQFSSHLALVATNNCLSCETVLPIATTTQRLSAISAVAGHCQCAASRSGKKPGRAELSAGKRAPRCHGTAFIRHDFTAGGAE